MNYGEQKKFLRGSRIWGAAVCLVFLAVALATRDAAGGSLRLGQSAVLLMTALAVAVLIYYTPDYLHLSVTPGRKKNWEIRVRWRVVAAVFVLGALFSGSNSGRLFTLFAVAWLAGANWLAAKIVPEKNIPVFFWVTDLIVLFFSLIEAGPGPATISLLLLAAAAHIRIVRTEGDHVRWAVISLISGLVVVQFATAPFSRSAFLLAMALLLIAAGGTAWLVHRARAQNRRNVTAALRELIEFTGYSEERIRELWATSNQQLAQNWQKARPAENNPEEMAEWYRQNSELYLFAISAYNLEYKRIRSNMKVLRLAHGATLDYGAGNGEILLELARRGHRVAYFDVDGVTRRFAQKRADSQGLRIDFFPTKDALAAAARERGFDTVFSFDVLEHLPDLSGELTFLSSLLAPGGVFVFDVPAGSTRAHPMHLNHNLDVLAFLRGKSLVDRRGIMLRLPFRKEEKYVFLKRA